MALRTFLLNEVGSLLKSDFWNFRLRYSTNRNKIKYLCFEVRNSQLLSAFIHHLLLCYEIDDRIIGFYTLAACRYRV